MRFFRGPCVKVFLVLLIAGFLSAAETKGTLVKLYDPEHALVQLDEVDGLYIKIRLAGISMPIGIPPVGEEFEGEKFVELYNKVLKRSPLLVNLWWPGKEFPVSLHGYPVVFVYLPFTDDEGQKYRSINQHIEESTQAVFVASLAGGLDSWLSINKQFVGRKDGIIDTLPIEP